MGGADSLDQGLAPFAEMLLLIIVLLFVTGAASYILNKYVQRQKEKAHNKISKSRRGKDTGIDLFAKAEADQVERSTSRSRSKSRSSGFNLVQMLKNLADRLDGSKRGSRRSRSKGRRRRRSGSSGNMRLDILKKDLSSADTGAAPANEGKEAGELK